MMEAALLMYLIGIITFLKNRYHVMTILLSFEFMNLSLFLFLLIFLMSNNYSLIVIYLIMIVVEASLGLSLLVMMSFFYGNDKIISMFMLKC
uniref:NADH dehydrogenase subunit 4L n=1 Tax=Ixodes rubicundus TaxID=722771 RepID=UPI00223795D8|nr:NADH dehydrogenase subunit 4L [Ixodes rubicundus]QLD97176.1 NADH dehydrogenase subunit 4L [Ixodes rubicundus]UYB78128.1 NADH dehydrogenase subunit 4L [Ixodes rubicundus]